MANKSKNTSKLIKNWGGSPASVAALNVAAANNELNHMDTPNENWAIRHCCEFVDALIASDSREYRKLVIEFGMDGVG